MPHKSLPLLLTALLGLTVIPSTASAGNFMNPFDWFEEMFNNDDDDNDYYRERYYRDRHFAQMNNPWGYGPQGPWQGPNWQTQQPVPEHIPE